MIVVVILELPPLGDASSLVLNTCRDDENLCEEDEDKCAGMAERKGGECGGYSWGCSQKEWSNLYINDSVFL